MDASKAELMGRFFDLTLALVCTARRDGNTFENLNPAWERTLGWSIEELCSRSFVEFIHPDDLQPTIDIIAKMDEGAPAVNFTNRYRHQDGRWIWLSWLSVLNAGTYYAAAMDVTALKQSQEALEESNAQLRHFAYGASHDLREPLTGIIGHLSLIDPSGLDADSRESLQFVADGAARLRQLLDGLAAYARVVPGTGPRSRVSLAKVLNDALIAVSTSADAAGAQIVTEGTMPVLSVDSVQIGQVFQNLLSNAIKYRRPDHKPKVIVRSSHEGERWCFEVSDDGVGIDPRHLDRAFQIFQRLHPRSQFDGSGIGLALVQRIVRQHGGEVGIRSALGQGTTVWFWLPDSQAKGGG